MTTFWIFFYEGMFQIGNLLVFHLSVLIDLWCDVKVETVMSHVSSNKHSFK